MHLATEMAAAGHPVSQCSADPGHRYPAHSRSYEKVLCCVEGSIVFDQKGSDELSTPDNRPGAEAGEMHSATAGEAGPCFVEAHLR